MSHPVAEFEYERWLDGTHPTIKIVQGDRPDWSAVFSRDDKCRYVLKRPADPAGAPVAGSMLVSCGQNPSVADAFRNDSTVRKEIGFAKLWRLALYVKINAYAWRATHPDDMWMARDVGEDIVGPRNNEAIRSALLAVKRHGGIALAAWGNDIEPDRSAWLAAIAREIGVQWWCLGTNKNGSPKHSLYPSYSTPLVRWPA